MRQLMTLEMSPQLSRVHTYAQLHLTPPRS